MRLADDATLRLELAAFPLAPGADGGIAAEHRAGARPPGMRPGPSGSRLDTACSHCLEGQCWANEHREQATSTS